MEIFFEISAKKSNFFADFSFDFGFSGFSFKSPDFLTCLTISVVTFCMVTSMVFSLIFSMIFAMIFRMMLCTTTNLSSENQIIFFIGSDLVEKSNFFGSVQRVLLWMLLLNFLIKL